MNPWLTGIIGGLGGAATNIGASMTREREEQLARDKLAQEVALRQQGFDVQREQMAQQQRQFEATQTAQTMSVGDVMKYIGIPLPEGVDPAARISTAHADNLMKRYEAQQTLAREQTAREGQAGILERAGAGRPATEAILPPDEGAMYDPGTPATPGVAANPRLQQLGALLRYGPLTEVLSKAMDPEKPKFSTAAPGSGILGEGGNIIGMVPPLPKDAPPLKVETFDRPDGRYKITTNTVTGESTTEKLPGVPGQPAFAPQRPEQPNAAQLYISTMQQYQKARELYGDADPRTQNLAAIAAGLRSQVDPATGTRTEAPKPVDPFKQAMADMLAGRTPPGAGIKNPVPPAAAPSAAPRSAAPPPVPGSTRVRDPLTGKMGWVPPGQPIPPGVEVIGR